MSEKTTPIPQTLRHPPSPPQPALRYHPVYLRLVRIFEIHPGILLVGWSGLVEWLRCSTPYSKIPKFPQHTILGQDALTPVVDTEWHIS